MSTNPPGGTYSSNSRPFVLKTYKNGLGIAFANYKPRGTLKDIQTLEDGEEY